MTTRFWPTGLETTAGVPAGALQSSSASVGSAVVTADDITLSGVTKGHNYRVTIDFSAVGAFESSRYGVSAACNDSHAVVTEELSAKTGGVVSLMLFVQSSCSHTWDYNEPLEISLQLEGVGWSGQTTVLTGLTAVVQEII